ncbi:MAG: ATP-binding protein, partial [Gemmatirosa sp.]
MTMPIPVARDARRTVRAVRARVRAALAGAAPASVVLAVSGGRDSMVLLDAACAVARDRLAGVATFDHGTGPHARAAVRRVRRAAVRRGLPVLAGRADLPDAGEAAWRAARWRFLRRAARRLGATTVATAHTRDDQIETVAMRVLRGAGPPGLAGLL